METLVLLLLYDSAQNEHYSLGQELCVESHSATAPAMDRPKPVGVSGGSVLPLADLSSLCVCVFFDDVVCHAGCHT